MSASNMAAPQKKSTFRSRVGGAIRRSTSFSTPHRRKRSGSWSSLRRSSSATRENSSPPSSEDSDNASSAGSVYSRHDWGGSLASTPIRITTPTPWTPAAPNPIPESPAREVAAWNVYPQPPSLENGLLNEAGFKHGIPPPPGTSSMSIHLSSPRTLSSTKLLQAQVAPGPSPTKSDHVSEEISSSMTNDERYHSRATDETRPLISRTSTPPIIPNLRETESSQIAQPVPRWAQPARFPVNGSTCDYVYGLTPRLHTAREWTEYTLPHGIPYYVNEATRTITDLDLRNPTIFDRVSSVLDLSDDVQEGCEMWVRVGSSVKRGWWKHEANELVVSWVDHRHRRILHETPSDDYVSSGSDDRLDDDYRYWTFIETYPAHVPRTVVESARKDAIDVIDGSSRRFTHPDLLSTPPLFSQAECVELLKLLNDPNHPITAAYTRTIARTMLRGVHWNQANFRPHQPLPRDISCQQPARTSVSCTIFEFFLGLLCLGIPFLYAHRSRYHSQFDIEGAGRPLSTMPLFVTGACACLVIRSMITLSVSVMITFSRELEGISRIGGLVAITCAMLSMILSLFSILWYKAKMARDLIEEASVMGWRQSFVLSLPIVFFVYSVVGFAMEIVGYSFQSTTLDLVGVVTSFTSVLYTSMCYKV